MITEEAAREGLTLFGVDELGLDGLDRRILETLCLRFAGRPVGLSTLAVSVGEEPETVEDVYEPFLLQAGLIMRTPRGRLAAPGAYAHLGLEVPVQAPERACGRRAGQLDAYGYGEGVQGRHAARFAIRTPSPTRTVARRTRPPED